MEAYIICILGDSQLVIWQLIGEYQCNNPKLLHCYETTNELLQQFVDVTITHIPRKENKELNGLAQQAFGYKALQ